MDLKADEKKSKGKDKSEPKAEPVRSAAELAWLDAEAARIEAQAALDKANNKAAETASALAEEKTKEGKNGVQGPGGAVYTVQRSRKDKGSEEPPRFPYTLRRAPEIRT